MKSSKPTHSNVYHEKEIVQNQRNIRYDLENNRVIVTCSRAILNSLFQHIEFREDQQYRLFPTNVKETFVNLRLYKHFKLPSHLSWSSNSKDFLLSTLLAIHETLSARSISFSPVEDIAYTFLVEKPRAFVCLMEGGWVVLRLVEDKWYLLDPKYVSIMQLSHTHLHLIIKQLLVDVEPVFKVSGGKFSNSNPDGTQTKITVQRVNSDRTIQSGSSKDGDRSSPIPKPPDPGEVYLEPRSMATKIESQGYKHVIDGMSNLQLSSQPGPSFRTGRQERSRSETRRQSLQISVREIKTPVTDERSDLDTHWPTVVDGSRRRARSNSRSYNVNRNKGLKNWQLFSQSEFKEPNKSEQTKVDKKAKEKASCCICLDSYPDHILYPCGHQCICAECKPRFVAKFKLCPICKKNITDVVKIFPI